MQFAILAAGVGSRLHQGGVLSPKPLTKVGGEPMVARLIRIFLSVRAESIAMIVNEATPEVLDWAESLLLPVPLHLVVRSTEGSMLSLLALSPHLTGEKFIVSAVDSVFTEEEFENFVDRFESSSNCDALMGVTGYIDDDRPLYVAVDDAMRITSFEERPGTNPRYVSGGLYGLTPAVWGVMKDCIHAGRLRMREFQQELAHSGMRVMAHPFQKIIDVDNPSDLAKADEFLANENRRDKT